MSHSSSHQAISCTLIVPTTTCRLALTPEDEQLPLVNGLTLQERFELCRSVAEECVSDQELLQLLRKKANPVGYDGFEPSGRMHIAQVNERPGHRHLLHSWSATMSYRMVGNLY